MYKTSHWAKLKTLLQEKGVRINTPLFHASPQYSAYKIIAEGFKARAGGPGNDAYHDNAVCFTRNLSFSKTGTFGDVVFVVDERDLKNRFKTYTYDWVALKDTAEERKHPAYFEYETRVSRTPGSFDVNTPEGKDEPAEDEFCLIETVISPRYIKAALIPYNKKLDYKEFIEQEQGKFPMFYMTRKGYIPVDDADSDASVLEVVKSYSRKEALKEVGMTTNPQLLKALAKYPNVEVQTAVADSYFTPPEALADLALSDDEYIKLAVVNNPKTPVSALLVLAHDEIEWVRMVLAMRNKNPEVLFVLAQDESPDIKRHVAYNEHTPEKAFEILVKDDDKNIMISLLQNPNLPKHIRQQARARAPKV